MMGLLLITAGLLALSNAHAKALTVNGRVVVDVSAAACGKKKKKGKRGTTGSGGDGGGFKGGEGNMVNEEDENQYGVVGLARNGGKAVIEGEVVSLGAGTGRGSGPAREKGQERGDDATQRKSSNHNMNNTWPPTGSSLGCGGVRTAGEAGLSLEDGLGANAADRAEKGQMKHSWARSFGSSLG